MTTIFRTGGLWAGLAAALMLGATAAAQEAPVGADEAPAIKGETPPKTGKSGPTITIGGKVELSSQQLADAKAVVAAFNAMSQGGFAALPAHRAALEAVLDHAPANYSKVSVSGDMVIVRTNPGESETEAMAAGLIAAALQQRSITIASTINIYPAASFLLGSYAVETKDMAGAIAYLDRGLKLQPKNAMLLSEKGAAYQQAKQPAAALAIYEAGLNTDGLLDMPSDRDRARLLRGRGYSLGELGRLDEALTAYEESLKAEPGNKLALGEIAYLKGLKAGKPASEGQVMVPQPDGPAAAPSPAAAPAPTPGPATTS